MTVESDNLREEIKELLNKCIKCGKCRSACSVLRVLREEQFSPRGQISLIESGYFDRIIYDCNLCKACEVKCPLNLKICEAFIKARNMNILLDKEIEENNELIKNINKTGNIYGFEIK